MAIVYPNTYKDYKDYESKSGYGEIDAYLKKKNRRNTIDSIRQGLDRNIRDTNSSYAEAVYTAAVDNGTYTNFVKDSAGYGLAQWTYWSRKEALLKYAQSKKKSIGDFDMQLEFLWKELSESYKGIIADLKNAKVHQ